MLRVTAYVALLRAVNVSGTGKLPMAQLKAIGEACGFTNVRTFIASGNLLFDSAEDEPAVTRLVSERVATYFGKSVLILVRTAAGDAQCRGGQSVCRSSAQPGRRPLFGFSADPRNAQCRNGAAG